MFPQFWHCTTTLSYPLRGEVKMLQTVSMRSALTGFGSAGGNVLRADSEEDAHDGGRASGGRCDT